VVKMTGEWNGRRLSIMALSLLEIEAAERGQLGKHVVISIMSPKNAEARIKSDPKAILRLRFYDLNEPLEGYEEVFEHKDAKSVRRFIEKHVDEVEMIVVHCEAGVSRSVGLAAALAKVLFGDDERFMKGGVPNSRVYTKVLEAFKVEASEPRVDGGRSAKPVQFT